MRLPRASRAKPARLVVTPAADAFVPRGALTPVVSAGGSRRRARLAAVCRRAFPGSSLGATPSSRIAHRAQARAAPLGVGYWDERLTVGSPHAAICRPGGARYRAGGARGARRRTQLLAAPHRADGILDLRGAVERPVRQQHAGESLVHEDRARIRRLGCAPHPAPAAVPAVPAVHVEIAPYRLATAVAGRAHPAAVRARLRGARLPGAGAGDAPAGPGGTRASGLIRIRLDGFPRRWGNSHLDRERHEFPGDLRLRARAGHRLRVLPAPARLAAALGGARARAHAGAPGGAAHAALAAHAVQPVAHHPRADQLGSAGGPGHGGAARGPAAPAPERGGAGVLAAVRRAAVRGAVSGAAAEALRGPADHHGASP